MEVSLERTDEERRRQTQASVLAALDQAENEQRPSLTLSESIIEFSPLEFDQPIIRDTTLANTGPVSATWTLMKEGSKLDCKPWLTVEPVRGTLQPGESSIIKLTAQVNPEHAGYLNKGEWMVEPDLLILHVEDGADYFLTVSMIEWEATFLTMPIEALNRSVNAASQMTADERRASFDTESPSLRQLPTELQELTSFIVDHGMADVCVFLTMLC